jgi:phosphatidylglycerol:prolipoprotein diacylglycerol transferase
MNPSHPHPEIDPVLVEIGPFAIRWYALAYIAGLVIGWQIMRRVCEQPPKLLSPVKIDDFLLWAALGVILGGRLGYVLFYKPGFYVTNPLAILTVWEGGMSFHGGLLGVIAAILPSRSATRPIPSCCPIWWPSWRRSACSSGAWRTSSTASCGAA